MKPKGVCPITPFSYLLLWIIECEKFQIFDSQGAKAGDSNRSSPVKIDYLKPELIP